VDATQQLISARSERQAMDWSLVLTSQDIASTLLHSPEDDRWHLAVEASDYERAMGMIRLYRRENRAWAWRKPLPWQGIWFHWGALAWASLMVLVFVADAGHDSAYRQQGILDSKAVMAGQWWRLFTAISLHADVGHLAMNGTVGFILLGLAMAQYGAGWAVLIAYVGGVWGNVAGLLLYPQPHRILGASGMVMAALGLVAIQSLSLLRQSRRAARLAASGLAAGLFLFLLLGVDPAADTVAHAGGFLSGIVLGGIVAVLPPRWWQNRVANYGSGGLAIALFLLTWWFSLK
jgi:rhomboid protease GluP